MGMIAQNIEQTTAPPANPYRVNLTREVIAGRQLGQLRPANTTAATIYTPPAGALAVIRTIVVCNVSDTKAVLASIFHDDDGTTYTQATALFWEFPVPLDSTSLIQGTFYMDDSDGNFAVKTSVANGLTFTVYGEEYAG